MFDIIICDDEPTIRNGLKKLIERSGLPLTVSGLASNGLEAMDMIQTREPAVVLMDINMPGMSGLEVIEQTRFLEIPVIFIIISGYDEFQYAQKACHLEVADYLLKPINKEEFILLLEKIIKKLEQTRFTETPGVSAVSSDSETSQDTQSKRLLHYIQKNFTDNNLSLLQLSEEFHLSQSYVTRLVKQESGKSFTELLNQYRIEHAKKLLTGQKDRKLWAIAEECGFTSQHYFSRVFKQATGYTPAEYRNLNS